MYNKSGFVIWMTGISGSGKTTLAHAIHLKLQEEKIPSVILDGDSLRKGLNSDLGFSDQDRIENQRRTAEVAKLFADNDQIAIVSLISPLESGRELARSIIGATKFTQVFINCPFNIAKKRDVKGLYAKAFSGELKNFTGLDSSFEVPVNPDLELRTDQTSVEECTNKVIDLLLSRLK